MEAEVGVVHPQASECQGLPATTEAKREAWNRVSPGDFRESTALLTP